MVDERPTLTFLDLPVPVHAAPCLIRLSFVQGVFEPVGADSEALQPIAADPGFDLPPDLVWGAKYRGKTHELVTQLAVNLALAHADGPVQALLDPMAGRGTTLLWAARYRIPAWGVELDPRAPDDLIRHVKRQAHLHRFKHKMDQGSVGPRRKDRVGRYVHFTLGRDGTPLRLLTGDSRALPDLVGPRAFGAIVADLPYGVQHTTTDGARDPTEALRTCAPAWSAALRPGGVLALVFNRLRPKRGVLHDVFAAQGLVDVGVEAPHRVSESIWRDVLVMRRGA